MVRVTSIGKPLGDKIERAIRKLNPSKCCDIYVEEHGRRLRIRIEDVRKVPVNMPEAVRVVNEILGQEPYTSFNQGYLCIFYYRFS